jgi:hypothetical protein
MHYFTTPLTVALFASVVVSIPSNLRTAIRNEACKTQLDKSCPEAGGVICCKNKVDLLVCVNGTAVPEIGVPGLIYIPGKCEGSCVADDNHTQDQCLGQVI